MSLHYDIEHFTSIASTNNRVPLFEPLHFQTVQQPNLLIFVQCFKQIDALEEHKFDRTTLLCTLNYNLFEDVTVQNPNCAIGLGDNSCGPLIVVQQSHFTEALSFI